MGFGAGPICEHGHVVGACPPEVRAQQATKDGLRQADGDQRCGLDGKSAQTKPSPTGRACFKTHLGGAPSEQKTPRIEWRAKRPAACYVLVPPEPLANALVLRQRIHRIGNSANEGLSQRLCQGGIPAG